MKDLNTISHLGTMDPVKMGNNNYLSEMWSTTVYDDPDIAEYACTIMESEIRIGVRCQGLIFFILLISATILNRVIGTTWNYSYSYSLIAVLSLHTFISAKKTKGIASLYLLSAVLFL